MLFSLAKSLEQGDHATILLDTRTLSLKNFTNVPCDEYAILSHTWREGQEVTFEELGTEAAKSKSGYEKIEQCCRIALAHGFECLD